MEDLLCPLAESRRVRPLISVVIGTATNTVSSAVSISTRLNRPLLAEVPSHTNLPPSFFSTVGQLDVGLGRPLVIRQSAATSIYSSVPPYLAASGPVRAVAASLSASPSSARAAATNSATAATPPAWPLSAHRGFPAEIARYPRGRSAYLVSIASDVRQTAPRPGCHSQVRRPALRRGA